MSPDPTHDKATLISANRAELTAFITTHSLPLRVGMVVGPLVDPANPMSINEQLFAAYHAKNNALAPWLGNDGKVYSPIVLRQMIDIILSPPCPSVVILIKPYEK